MIQLFYLLVILAIYLFFDSKYKKTEYYLQTKNPFLHTHLNKGKKGEYLIFKNLHPLEGKKRFLFNLYIPKRNGDTTEIDVVLLHESGIHIFEPKNYSGWIFGSEANRYWTQVLPLGRRRSQKNRFFNPILQNKTHVKWLLSYLSDSGLHAYSYAVFSNRCTFKDITLTSGKHDVIHRRNILPTLRHNAAMAGRRLTDTQIDALCEKLFPLTQADETEKFLHGVSVREKQISPDEKPVFRHKQPPRPARETAQPDIGTLCPRCGGRLVVRTAAKGERKGRQFSGCSDFPKCRYTQNIPKNQP